MKKHSLIFSTGKLTFGLFLPIENYKGPFPTLKNSIELSKTAESLGFDALWLRDIPLFDKAFGEVGQIHETWIYLTYLAQNTTSIKLGTASLILPFRHPIFTAKSANSIESLFPGRLILGVGRGDRESEFSVFNIKSDEKFEYFKDSFLYLKKLLSKPGNYTSNYFGRISEDLKIIPESPKNAFPIFTTGFCGQNLEWHFKNADGWMTIPRPPEIIAEIKSQWDNFSKTNRVPKKPFIQSLFIDLVKENKAEPTPIHLGFRTGLNHLIDYFDFLQTIGINHIILNLKHSERPALEVIKEISKSIITRYK